jgi:ABC-type nitrate/sulfonate/bicarbonate transport system permease component
MKKTEERAVFESGAQNIATRRYAQRRRFGKLLSLFMLVLIWQAVSFLNLWRHFYNPQLFPSPLDVVASGWRLAQSGALLADICVSTLRVLEGALVAAPIAVFLAIAIGRLRWAENAFEPIVELLRPMPPLALLPIIILWFGIGEASKIFFVSYSCFFVVYTSVVIGVRRIDPVFLRAGESLGLTKLQLYRFVILQAVLPDIMLGIRLALSVGFLVIVAAEFIAADAGLGYLINYSRIWFRVGDMLVGAILIGILGVTSNYLLLEIERRLFPWRIQST